MSCIHQDFNEFGRASVNFRAISAVVLGLALSATTIFAQTQNPAAAPRLEASASAAAATPNTVTGSDMHTLGLGLRLGGSGFGAGLSFKWFPINPIGLQAEWHHYGSAFADFGFNEYQFAGLYRLRDIKFESPVILSPFVGGGVNIVDTGIAQLADNTDIGGVFLGGVEVFFAQVPKLGVSAEFAYTTNSFNYTTFGGAGVSIAAHWYFK